MGDPLVAALRGAIEPARIQAAADLSSLTTMRVGGPARALVRAETFDDLRAVGVSGRPTRPCRGW